MTITKADPRLTKELITVPVAGMTCRACEKRITKVLSALPGVISASASTRKGTASLIITPRASRASIDKAIVGLGYRLGSSPWFNRDPLVWRSASVAAVLVAILIWVVGVGDLTGRLGDLSTGGLLLVLALGLAAGVSTCMAMVGGIVLAISASASVRSGATGATGATGASAGLAARTSAGAAARTSTRVAARTSPLRINLAFQTGRIAGFGLLGVGLGALGGSTKMPQPVVIALMALVAVTMLVLGVRLSELSPRIAGWSPTIPAALGDRLGLTGDVPARRTAGAAVVGALTFFLPCGFTQAVQLYAFSTGSPMAAGAIMATFALGTAPALLALAGAPTLLKGNRRVPMLRALGIVVIGFAAINATSALRLAGVDLSIDFGAGSPQTVTSNVVLTPVSQTINTEQHATGYEPSESVIYAGRPTQWAITSTAPFSCAASLSAPALGVEGMLSAGRNVVDLPELSAGTYNYSCSMGMYSGRIVVIAPPTPPAN